MNELHQLHSLQTTATRLDCSLKTVKRCVARGLIKSVLIGRHRKVSELEIRRIVAEGLGTASDVTSFLTSAT